MQELSLMIRSREPELAQRLGRTPTNADLAADLGVEEREIRQGQEAISVHKAQSLNVPLYHDGESKDLADVIGAADGDLESLADRDALGRAMRVLPERYAEVLRLRFVDELTQTQIADKIGSSQMHVSRMISRAVALLRKHMVAERPAPLPT
jgi:RNA polymerase sigma-B factor